jgi:hypothetical protein
MNWLAVRLALAQIILAIVEMARERQAKGVCSGQGHRGTRQSCARFIRKARDARRAVSDTAS